MSATTASGPSLRLPIDDLNQAVEARRLAVSLGEAVGCDETTRGALAIIATEMATNLARHGRSGELLLRPLRETAVPGVELMAVDRGPGIDDLDRALQDGYSTGGTAGEGLGAIRRKAHVFDIHSTAAGTVVLARVFVGQPVAEAFTVGAVCLPIAGETACGDAWAAELRDGRLAVAMVDGLGHGPLASDAGLAGLAGWARGGSDVTQAIQAAHAALRPTRGAAMLAIVIDPIAGEVRCCGVGNIAGTVLSEPQRRMVSHNGICGHSMSRTQAFTYPCAAGTLVVLHSDGLHTQWKLDHQPGLASRHPSIIAAVLWREFSRGRDDVTVVAVRGAP